MKFVVYGTNSCSYCVKATSLLEREGYGNYQYNNIQENDEHRKFIVEVMEKRTVPQIFEIDVNGNFNHIGGYEELVDYLSG